MGGVKTKTRRNTKSGGIASVSNSTPKVEKFSRVIKTTPKVEKDRGVARLHQKWRNSTVLEKLHQKCMLRCVGGLADFLREHQGEWYSPHEIHKMGGGDIRTVKKRIDHLANPPRWDTDREYRIEIARRGKRIYCVRFIGDTENSIDSIKARIAEKRGAG